MSTKITARMAAVMLEHSGPGRVQALIRKGTLPKVLTVEAVNEYKEKRRAKSPSGDAKWFKVRLTEAQAQRLADEGFQTVDPYSETRAREARKMEEARAALDELE